MDPNGDALVALDARLKGFQGAVIISYSGGLDSSFLAMRARQVIPGRARCIILDSPLVTRRTIDAAKARAEQIGIPCDVIPFPILDDRDFRENPPRRCYICKKRGSALLRDVASSWGGNTVIDGVNASDYLEYRPGILASDEEGILHPLAECGLGKSEIRDLSRREGYPFSDVLSAPCLATRFPYGMRLTAEGLRRIEDAEAFLAEMGFECTRVRVHGTVARIEVPPDEIASLVRFREVVARRLRGLGFTYITLDLEGFRSGSMDEDLPEIGHGGMPG